MYNLIPNNPQSQPFKISAFHWPLILDQCGTYFIAVGHKARFFYVTGIDERMGESIEGPAIIMNSGFPITEEEAKVLARIARNYVAIQQSITTFEQKQAEAPWMDLLKPQLIDTIEAFAEWSETSGGFEVR